SSTQNVTITITGTNDAPVLDVISSPVAVVELTDASAQDLAAITGTLSVSDRDVGDTLTASVASGPVVKLNGSAFTLPSGARALSSALSFDATATSDGGAKSIGWTYDPAAANLDFLRAGQTLTLTYAVKVNDGTAERSTQNVTITIAGTNDAPVLDVISSPVAVVELTDASAQDLAA